MCSRKWLQMATATGVVGGSARACSTWSHSGTNPTRWAKASRLRLLAHLLSASISSPAAAATTAASHLKGCSAAPGPNASRPAAAPGCSGRRLPPSCSGRRLPPGCSARGGCSRLEAGAAARRQPTGLHPAAARGWCRSRSARRQRQAPGCTGCSQPAAPGCRSRLPHPAATAACRTRLQALLQLGCRTCRNRPAAVPDCFRHRHALLPASTAAFGPTPGGRCTGGCGL